MRQRTRSIWAVLAAGALAVLGLAAVPSAAFAAAPYETNGTVSNVKFVETTITDGKLSELTGEWSLPNNPTKPAGFTLALPKELQGRSETFDLKATDTGESMGTCVVSATTLDCSVDDDYITKNPRNLRGTFTFWASTQVGNSEEVVKDFTFTDVEGKTTVTVKPNKCTERCEFTGWSGQKFGSYDQVNNAVWWYIEIPAPVGGMTAGEEIVVTDTPGDGQKLEDDSDFIVQETSTVMEHESGRSYPDGWSETDRSRIKVTNGPPHTATWTAEQGKYYRIQMKLAASSNDTTVGNTTTYTNDATIKVGSKDLVEVSNVVKKQGGSGTGIGDNVGTFTINKKVTGDAIVSADTEFTVHYVVTSSTGTVLADADATVSATKSFTSEEYPTGAKVKLSEAKPKDSASVTWAAPVFDKAEFALEGGTNTVVALTNTASLETGVFKAKKVLSGTGASLIPADAEFTVKYNYPAGDAFPAGAGELKLRADGTEVTSPKLPVGAVLKLSEVAPAAVDGATWGKAKFNKDTVTIAKDETVEVTLENPITTVPPTTAPPTTPETTTPVESTPVESTPATTPSTPPLANTGASVGIGVGVAVLLLVGGLLTVGSSRRRARH